ncbi:MAG: hypothetical protein ACTSUE_16805 [Promethearchaeota archaeon]
MIVLIFVYDEIVGKGGRVRKWKRFKRKMDTRLFFISRKNAHWRVKTFSTVNVSSQQLCNIEEGQYKIPQEIRKIVRKQDDTTNGNVYIAYFDRDGFRPRLDSDIVYVGKVCTRESGKRKRRTIMERWRYGGGDHGGQARQIICGKREYGATAIDDYLAEFNFDSRCVSYVYILHGVEREIIDEMRLLERKLRKTEDGIQFEVVNLT